MLKVRGNFPLFCVIAISLTVSAQNSDKPQSKETVVGIVLDSNYQRIADFLPRLTESLVKSTPKKGKQVRLMALASAPQDAEDSARARGCDYLLRMNVSEITGAGAGASFGRQTHTMSPEEERERRELSWVRIDYRLQSLKGDGLNIDDMDVVRYLDYPSVWDATAFETTVFRTVTRVTNSTLGKLPKK